VNEPRVPAPAAPGGMPPDGVLEELDGTPVGASATRPSTPAVPWHRGVATGAAVTAARPRLWVFALVAFLARGGVLVLVLPIVILPTFIGIANAIGPAFVSADGPTARVVALVVAGVAAVAALVVAGTFVAAAAEVALHRATVEPDPDDAPEPGALDGPILDGPIMVLAPARSGGRLIARVTVLRLMLLVPLVAVAAAAVPTWVVVAYRELTLPSDVAAPLLLRVLAGAPVAGGAVLVTWLAAEVIGGFATRRAVLFGASVPRALGAGLLDPLRAPVGTALTVLAALALSAIALLPATWALGAAWDAARRILVDDAGAVAALAAALVLSAAWLVALVLAGIAAAGRATLMTAELLRRPRRAGSLAASDPASPAGAARHAVAGPPVG
jgi:hypothetical protein